MRASEGPACGRITHGPHPLSPSPQMWRGGTTGQHFFPSFSSGATRRCHPERARECARAKDLLAVASRIVLTPCPPLHRCGEGERRTKRGIDGRVEAPLSAYAERGTGGEDRMAERGSRG